MRCPSGQNGSKAGRAVLLAAALLLFSLSPYADAATDVNGFATVASPSLCSRGNDCGETFKLTLSDFDGSTLGNGVFGTPIVSLFAPEELDLQLSSSFAVGIVMPISPCYDSLSVTPVPEPSTVLFGSALLIACGASLRAVRRKG